jgi:hypothetical protein
MSTVRFGQAPTTVLRGVLDDTHLADIALRNKHRAQQLIAQLGAHYACHPNKAPRKVPQEGVLK